MPDLVPASLTLLLKRAFYEPERQQTLFDLPLKDLYRGSGECDLSARFHGLAAGTPLGPAAGPHDQLAQNIVLAWLGGSRIIELKTVQILDELKIQRPCIDATNIGFNIEWSQELKLQESLLEYVKASMLIEILREENALGVTNPAGLPRDFYETIFDLSVGYDLKGIESDAVSGFICKIKHADELIDQLRSQIPDEYQRYREYPFRTELVKTATLSTFHGCPKDEIERICRYLLTEMGLHTIIKLNPVQLGQERLEEILYERLGYRHLKVNQKAYDTGLSLSEALEIVQRLEPLAREKSLNIGVKFSNTLEVYNTLSRLPDEVMYLSGPPLHVIAVTLLAEWRKLTGTRYPISFAAGIDRRNFANAAALGLAPITVCTDLLKPRGYARQEGYLKELATAMRKLEARTLDGYILKFAGDGAELEADTREAAILRNTSRIAAETLADPRYAWAQNSKEPRKVESHLFLFDCLSCDKCLPVCPNDANFVFEVEPVSLTYRDYRLTRGKLLPDARQVFTIEQAHQLANFADFCNECGNCDTFCPEYGGPFIEKPGFFGSRASWEARPEHDGFFVECEEETERIGGRIAGQVYFLEHQRGEDQDLFDDGSVRLKLQPSTGSLLEWTTHEPVLAEVDPAREPYQHHPDHLIEMRNYYRMAAILRGVLNASRVHYVNAKFL